MRYACIYCKDLVSSIYVRDFIEMFGYKTYTLKPDGSSVIKMVTDKYFDMIRTIPFIQVLMEDELTVTKVIIEEKGSAI